tara:strand:- start:22 stop:459 length:438 start_codon:yes stop_codon:yes gene_type:complete
MKNKRNLIKKSSYTEIKRGKLIANIQWIAVNIIGLINLASPANAGVLFDASIRKVYLINDGNPRMIMTDGSRTSIFFHSSHEYPLDNKPFGFERSAPLYDPQLRWMADLLTKCGASHGYSLTDVKATYKSYAGESLWRCNKHVSP